MIIQEKTIAKRGAYDESYHDAEIFLLLLNKRLCASAGPLPLLCFNKS